MKKYFAIIVLFFSLIGFNSANSAEHIAFFAASSENGFNQAVYEGVEAKAKEMGATSKMFNGEFNAVVQAQQIEDAIASKEFDGFANVLKIIQIVLKSITLYSKTIKLYKHM